jgi:hypothetical protein
MQSLSLAARQESSPYTNHKNEGQHANSICVLNFAGVSAGDGQIGDLI